MVRIFDTNHATAHLNGDPRLAPHLRDAVRRGDTFGITVTVLAELFSGAYCSQRVQHNLTRLAEFTQRVVLYDFDATAAEEYGRIVSEQRAKGRPIPVADAQIAATSRVVGATLLSDDAHFQGVDGILVEDWLAVEGA